VARLKALELAQGQVFERRIEPDGAGRADRFSSDRDQSPGTFSHGIQVPKSQDIFSR